MRIREKFWCIQKTKKCISITLLTGTEAGGDAQFRKNIEIENYKMLWLKSRKWCEIRPVFALFFYSLFIDAL